MDTNTHTAADRSFGGDFERLVREAERLHRDLGHLNAALRAFDLPGSGEEQGQTDAFAVIGRMTPTMKRVCSRLSTDPLAAAGAAFCVGWFLGLLMRARSK